MVLVVSNSTDAHIGRLPKPGERRRSTWAAALRRLGFEVTTELDADRVELSKARRAFTRRSSGADVSLVFYAGYGIEMDGVSYVVPVDGRLERDVDVRYETVTLERPAGVDGGRARDWRGSLGHGDPVRRRQRPDRRRHRPERQLGDGRAQHGRSPVGRLDRLRTRPPAGHAASRQPRVPGPVSSDAKWVIGLAAIVLAILGSAFIVSNVMITLAGMVREDLHDLRESLERAACGEFARVFPGPGGGLAAPGADPNRRRAEETVSAPPAWPSGGNAERKPAVSVCSDR